MQEKYYTPTLDEFHVGFEFETAYGGRLDQWNKDVFTQEDLWHGRHPTHETYRVKYLDHDDIIECGWYDKIQADKYYFQTDICEWQMKPDAYQNDKMQGRNLSIFYSHGSIDSINEIIVWVKNKSELKKLMKQLGIEK